MGTLATLTIDLVGQSAKLRADLAKASKQTKSWSEKTRSFVNTAGKAFAAMGVTAVTAWAAIYVETSKTADLLAKTSDKLGILPEKLQALQHAGEQTGVGVETTNMALQRMVRRVAEAGQGTGEAVGALKELNLNATELAQMSPDEQFKAIAEAMSGVSNQGDKVRLAMKLFDSEGVSLVNTLDLGREGLNAMEQEINDLGIAMDRLSLAKIEMANDAFDKATKSTSSFGNALTTSTAPIVGALSDMFTQAAMEAGGFGNIAQNVMKATVTSIGFVSDAGRGLKVVFMLIRQAVAELANEIIQLGTTGSKVGAALAEFFGFESSTINHINKFAESFSGTTERLKKELQDTVAEPMPSEKIKAWFDDVQQKFEYEAQKIADDKKNNINLGATISTSTSDDSKDNKSDERLVESARNRYQQIYDAKLLQEERLQELEERKYERLQEEMEREIELLRSKNLATAEIESNYRIAKEQAEEQHQQKIADIEKNRQLQQAQQRVVELQNYSQLFDGMAGITASFKGEQSGMYRAMFAASKAFSVAESIIKIQQGIANAASLPWPQNLAAISSTVATTAGVISTIQGTNLQGMAHSGIDTIPREGTWLLDKGERVYTQDSARQLDEMYNATVTTNNTPVNITLNYDIKTNSAKDFRQVLMENNQYVFNAVESVMNKKGRRL
ncbi:hypothetical protein [Catenovulum sediminis]|uniref:Bacteriophage tail tape measure C-terminal domain-containing protein n=1 Tax=Catenovulum sediminis TaxID=1740262 RepID=A0ABV1RK95_9ALTE|nr:hypothetical protein [Catenovulum sediminis]